MAVNNHQPVNLPCAISQVFELLKFHFIFEKLNKSLKMRQLASRMKISAKLKLIDFSHKIDYMYDETAKKMMSIFCLDFEVTFNKMLSLKLHQNASIMVSVERHNYSKDFALEWKTSGKMNATFIMLQSVISGVKQGSFLRPLFWLY